MAGLGPRRLADRIRRAELDLIGLSRRDCNSRGFSREGRVSVAREAIGKGVRAIVKGGLGVERSLHCVAHQP